MCFTLFTASSFHEKKDPSSTQAVSFKTEQRLVGATVTTVSVAAGHPNGKGRGQVGCPDNQSGASQPAPTDHGNATNNATTGSSNVRCSGGGGGPPVNLYGGPDDFDDSHDEMHVVTDDEDDVFEPSDDGGGGGSEGRVGGGGRKKSTSGAQGSGKDEPKSPRKVRTQAGLRLKDWRMIGVKH